MKGEAAKCISHPDLSIKDTGCSCQFDFQHTNDTASSEHLLFMVIYLRVYFMQMFWVDFCVLTVHSAHEKYSPFSKQHEHGGRFIGWGFAFPLLILGDDNVFNHCCICIKYTQKIGIHTTHSTNSRNFLLQHFKWFMIWSAGKKLNTLNTHAKGIPLKKLKYSLFLSFSTPVFSMLIFEL